MDMAGMFAGIATQISSAFGGPYHPARVIDQQDAIYDDGGSIVTPGTAIYRDCSAQVDSVTEAMRREGYTEGDVRFLILVGTLAGSLNTDARVQVLAGPHAGTWLVSALERDPCGAYWSGRGRRDGAAPDSPVIRLLSGGITGSATLYAKLLTATQLAGAIHGGSAANGTVSLVASLSGGVSGSGILSGGIGASASLSGAVVGAGGVSGGVSITQQLRGGVSGVGALTGAIGSTTMLAGGIVGVGSGAGVVTIARSLAGAVTGAGALSGGVTTQTPLSGAVAGAGGLAGAISSGTSEDSATTAYANAMTVPPSPQRRSLINDLIAGLKADGVWQKLDWLVLLAAHDAQAGRLNAANPAKALQAVNSPTFTTDRGFSGDASAAHLSFGEAFNASGNLFALTSATIGVWCNQMSAFSGQRPHIGSSQSTRTFISPANSGNAEFRVNDSTATYFDGTTRLGHRTGVRADSVTKRYYRDGVSTQTATVSGGAVATGPAYLLRNGTAYADDRLAAAYSGAGMSDADALALHNRLNTYLTAIGAN